MLRRDESGAELVETAIALPVLLLVAIAGMSLLWLAFVEVQAGAAAREGARIASLAQPPTYRTHPGADDVARRVAARTPVLRLQPGDVEVTYPGCPAPCAAPPANSPVTVTIHKRMPAPFAPFARIFVPAGRVTASSTGEVRAE
jgi:Flp pilus assembly protein TadG